jgi:AraC family transcriptional regulator, transcriptional activator of pobA
MQTTLQQSKSPIGENYFFRISRLESTDAGGNAWVKPVQLPHYQIVWISRGSGYFNIDLEKYRIESDTVYTIPTGRFHQILSNEHLSGFVLSFNLDFLGLGIDVTGQPLFKEISSDLKTIRRYTMKREDGPLPNILAEINTVFKANSLLRREILSSLVKLFLIYVKRQSTSVRDEKTSSRRIKLVNKFCAKLEDQFRTKKQVADYANDLFVTPNYLTNVVKKVTGHSARYHIQQRTVEEAKRLVIYDDATLKMVAYALGFEDISHFSKYFKKGAGMNFTDFRKRTCSHFIN